MAKYSFGDDTEKNHPKYQEILQLYDGNIIKSNRAFQVYLDLCEVREWWNVRIHHQPEVGLVFLEGHPTRHEPRQLVLPVSSEEYVTPHRLHEILTTVSVENYNSDNGIILAVLDCDSTLVYYKISTGLVMPEHPEFTEDKRHQRSLRYRHRQSHVQEQLNHYMKIVNDDNTAKDTYDNEDTVAEDDYVNRRTWNKEDCDLVTLDEEDGFEEEL